GLVEDPEERARHLGLATDDPDGSVALALEEAARLAFARGAPDAAAGLFEHAARLTPPEDADASNRRLLEAARSHDNAGQTGEARSLLEQLASAPISPAGRLQVLLLLGQVR